jgi:hypothetical protein
MTKHWRILLEVLAPPGLGAAIFIVQLSVASGRMFDWPDWDDVHGLFLASYIYATIPSLVYAIALESSLRNGLGNHSGKFVLLSTVLGTFAGVVIGFFIGLISYLVITGAITGLILGLLIMALPWADLPNARMKK